MSASVHGAADTGAADTAELPAVVGSPAGSNIIDFFDNYTAHGGSSAAVLIAIFLVAISLVLWLFYIAATAAGKNHTNSSDTTTVAPPPQTPGVLNVKAFGAVGDGKTDDSDAVQLAMSTLGAGETLLFPQGTYRITRSLDTGSPSSCAAGTCTGRPDQTITGTGGATILAAYGGPKWFGEHCWNIFGPNTTIKDLIFTTDFMYAPPSASPTAFGGLNFTSSASFGTCSGLKFRVRLANIRACIVVDAHGMNIHGCTFLCQNSPGHGIYLSGGDYNAQQPFDIRIENNHFQEIGDNAIQVPTAFPVIHTHPSM